ncbi:MAG: hypothetical protein LBF75_02535 [Treponema sp.]|nr:hypothetical protein [Treponema sp.]
MKKVIALLTGVFSRAGGVAPLKKAGKIIVSVTFGVSILFEIYFLLFDDTYPLSILTCLETFPRCIIFGFGMGILAYFWYAIARNTATMTRKKYAIITGSLYGLVVSTAIGGVNLLCNRPFGIINGIVSFVFFMINGSLYMADGYLVKKGKGAHIP